MDKHLMGGGGGIRNIPGCLVLQKLEVRPSLMSHLGRMQT